MSVSRFTPTAVSYTVGPCRIAKDVAYFVAMVFANLSRLQGRNLSFLAKHRDSDIVAMVSLYMMVHSQVAVLLPVGEARAMPSSILKADG